MPPTIDSSHPSPNHSPRNGEPITMIVLHATVGDYAASLAWLTNPQSRVSVHYLISKTGHIARLVPDDLAAWHAGASFWRGRGSLTIQDESIGIELENANTGHDPYPPNQIASLTALTRDLVARYQIALDDVVRHLDIATPPGRKTDPAGFPWDAWKAALPPTHRYRAGPFGAIAHQDRRPDAKAAAAWMPGETILSDDLTDGWIHVSEKDPKKDVGFVPVGQLVGPL